MIKIDFTNGLYKAAEIIRRKSMENCPVETGYLRNSHETIVTDGGVEIHINANYATYVEYGTSKWVGSPFIRPAIESEKNLALQAIVEEINKEIK